MDRVTEYRLRKALWSELKNITDINSAYEEINLFVEEADCPEATEIADRAWTWALEEFKTINGVQLP